MPQASCLLKPASALTTTFAKRMTGPNSDPQAAMLFCIRQLRRKVRVKTISSQLQSFLRVRNIKNIAEMEELKGDGCLQPLGTSYKAGFTVLVRKNAPLARRRFTLAHELCHTFFYESVPEFKFVPHETDEFEERLCDVGAAEILMPEARLRRTCAKIEPCLSTLFVVSRMYAVSIEAMMIRLRSLGYWDCELSFWYKTGTGKFALDRTVGGKQTQWKWIDDSPLQTAWNNSSSSAGHAFVEYTDERGNWYAKPVWFEVQRRSDRVVSLWARRPVATQQTSLFLS